MPYRDIVKDTTSFIGKVFLRDSTTGLGKTGVADTSMSGDYCKDTNAADVTLSFSAGSVGDTYSSGKWAEIGNGYYFYHYPNGCWDTFGETGFTFRASGAIDAAPRFRVVAIDSEDLGWASILLAGGQIISGVASGTPTTTTMPASTLASTANDHWNGRIIIWTSGTLAGQATDITDYVDSSRTFTFTAVTVAATAADTFIII